MKEKRTVWKQHALAAAVASALAFGVMPMAGKEAAAHVTLTGENATEAVNAMRATRSQADVPAVEADAVSALIVRCQPPRWPSGNLAHFFRQRA